MALKPTSGRFYPKQSSATDIVDKYSVTMGTDTGSSFAREIPTRNLDEALAVMKRGQGKGYKNLNLDLKIIKDFDKLQ